VAAATASSATAAVEGPVRAIGDLLIAGRDYLLLLVGDCGYK
jgi:hypothetical protein